MARANPVDKHDARRRALADSALQTLGELGYARASLREIAQHSPYSHGVVHYHFADELELIVYCDDPHALDTLRAEVRDLLPLTLRPVPVGAGTGT
ncbi:hypothetical protein GCM10025792_26380 [Pseudonocardia tropica]|uniref:TetR/AcrR family transcriptional regulator n=1 Tax=Pseudonocardia tropica TaxID=681289 RepID=UPI0033741B0F